ncbi:LysR family transcriptional regulator [Sphingomonas mali]|uniref:LysR family transcriptional regulator n=1 Tax=Sphingomonas mali TaxID=40682 RepID=UPI00082CFB66|nr:LysR family transcriptional regulator [Sphingomonas mali]
MAFRGSLQDIRLFIAAYEEGSFTAAATRENSTQSGVSHHISQLEALLKVKLFDRARVGVTATPAADIFYQRCAEMLRSIDQASNDMSQYSRGHQGNITIAAVPALTNRLIAPALLQLSQSHPNVKVRVIESSGSIMAEMVSSGMADFAFSTLEGRETGIQARPMLTTPQCLVSRAMPDTPSTANGMPNQPINMAWGTGMRLRRTIIRACLEMNHVRINSSLELGSSLAMLDLVSRSDWHMVAPCVMFDPVGDADRFFVRPLRRPDVNYEIMLLQRSTAALTQEAEAFAEIIADGCRKATDAWVERFEAEGWM